MATRVQRVSRAIRFIMIAADSNTIEEFERERRKISEDDREFSVMIANQLIELTDALLEPLTKDLHEFREPVATAVEVVLDGKKIAEAVAEYEG